MSRCIDGHIRRNLHIASDHNLRHIQDRQIIVGKEVFPNLNIAAVVTVKRLLHCQLFPVHADDLSDQPVQRLLLFWTGMIELKHFLFGLLTFLCQSIQPCTVWQFRQHSLFLIHLFSPFPSFTF